MKQTSKYILAGFGILLVLAIIAVLPTTCIVNEAYTVEYQEPVYKIVKHSDPIYEDKYKTVKHSDPIYEDKYKTVSHSDPEYKTLYTYSINYNIVKNVYGLDKEYTGDSFWGSSEYTVIVYYYDGMSKKTKTFYQVKSAYIVHTDTYEAIIGYDTWTEQVSDGQKIVGYDIWTEQVLDGQEIVGYDTWSETVIDKHVTKEKTEYRDKEVDCMICEKLGLV